MRKILIPASRLLGGVVLAWLAASWETALANGPTYQVHLNTAPLIGQTTGPFSIAFTLSSGNGIADGKSTATISNVNFGGGMGFGSPFVFGGVSGNLESGVTLTTSETVGLFAEYFSPGQTLDFVVTVTTTEETSDFPADRLAMFILDGSGVPIPTLSPGADYFWGVDLLPVAVTPDVFSSDTSRFTLAGPAIAIDAPTTTIGNPSTTPPVTVAALSPLPNADGWNNSNVTVSLTSTDQSGSGVKQIKFAATGAQTTVGIVPGSAASIVITKEGTTTIQFSATDNAGNTESRKLATVKIDKTPPTIVGLPAPGCILSPPNGSLVQVATVSAGDVLSGLASLSVSGQSNEPTSPGDIVINGASPGPFTVQLRAVRLATGMGRVYTLTAVAQDVAGNVATANATCGVPGP